MDPAPVSKFLGDAKVVEIEARPYPVDVRYLPDVAMSEAARIVAKEAKGHILCFLPGAREIERTRLELALPNVYPLHGSLDGSAEGALDGSLDGSLEGGGSDEAAGGR